MKRSRLKKRTPSDQERRLSFFLLGVLALIAGVVFTIQSRYDAGEWREQTDIETRQQISASGNGRADGLQPISAQEQYDATNLSEKINGKADLYLTAGFKQMTSRRFGLSSNTGRWMERYVYQMNSYRSAYAVFSLQRRTDVELLDLGGHAYYAGNGLFLVHGRYYLEIIAAEVSEEMRTQAVTLAEAFIAEHPVETETLPALMLFPQQDRVPNTTILNAASTFGLESLNWVFTSRYAADGHEATAFISRRESAVAADALASAFIAFWRDFGGEAVVLPEARAAYQTITILDNYELVWVQGEYLVGVHEATDLDFGLRLADRLRQAVREGRHDP